jgi:hypothetical protein
MVSEVFELQEDQGTLGSKFTARNHGVVADICNQI